MAQIAHPELQMGTETRTGRHIPCPTCTALADLALMLRDRTTGAVDYIFTCSRCGRVIWRNADCWPEHQRHASASDG